MKRKGLYFLIALALGGVGAVHAQDTTAPATTESATSSYDGRWYIAPTVGGYYNDTDRNTNSRQFYYGLGVGRFISPNASIDLFADRTKRDADAGGSWSNNTVGAAVRFYAGDWNAWRPYLLAGVMGSNHHSRGDSGWSPAAELGGGISKTVTDSSDVRIEAGYRYDWDNKTQPEMDGYGDWFLGFSIVSRFGAPAAAPAPVAATPPPADCSTMDSDGDSVNDCDDKCPGTAAGTIVGPDGCPQKVVIDLRGVNFKFDRPTTGEKNIAPTHTVSAAPSGGGSTISMTVVTNEAHHAYRMSLPAGAYKIGVPGDPSVEVTVRPGVTQTVDLPPENCL